MGIITWLGFAQPSYANNELPNIFPLSMPEGRFVEIDVRTIFVNILTDVLERTHGIADKYTPLFWDNCLASESNDGLVTMLARAIVNQGDLFLVYDPATNVARKANTSEQTQIRDDYARIGKSATGVFVTFKNYQVASMVRLYSALEYCTVASLNKTMNLSAAIQLKMKDLRQSVGAIDSDAVAAQAKEIAKALSNQRDVLLDAGDSIESAQPNLTATQAAMDFIAQKQSFYLGLPASYITGAQTGGLGDSGNADTKAIDRGLKKFYFAIIKPVVEALFGVKTSFRPDDTTQISGALEVLKTFEVTSEELISADNKRIIVNRTFGLPENAKGDAPVQAALPAPVEAAVV